MGSKISFVIPTYNHADLLTNLLMDILTYNSEVDEVFVVDNGSTDKELLFHVYEWWKEHSSLPITPCLIKDNVGFLKACNFGVSRASGDIIILVSNDVRIERPILAEVREKLNEGTILGGRLLDMDTGWNCFDGRVFKYLEGWLLCFRKEDWEKIGGFDERYCPHIFEDVDFSTSAISKGYSLVQLESAGVSHMGAQTINYTSERDALTRENQSKFKEKWLK
jgi:GT2 family glycosyltransferase